MEPANPNASLLADYLRIRRASLELAAPLAPEDTVVQSMADVSPTKWHLAHTTWFFEEFILQQQPGYRFHDPRWRFLFNSYYQSVGPMHARVARGLLSRPRLSEVLDYRAVIDRAMERLIATDPQPELARQIELGLQHEQQHQELILTDIKHVLSCNPLLPAYRDDLARPHRPSPEQRFVAGDEGVVEIGADSSGGFAFDCETPRHRSLLHPHALARRPVTNDEFRQFVADGGYRQPQLWLSEGWATVQSLGWNGPMYWDATAETEFTLGGQRQIDASAPVCHVSYYEADAFARWAGARLPTEAEWENAADELDPERGNFANTAILHPVASDDVGERLQMFGDVWEWTASPYVNYPGFKPLPGALGEYNGKFMCGQWVLRGGSCVTPSRHVRASYRNFFYPRDRWQFSGLRLAQERTRSAPTLAPHATRPAS